MRKIYYLGAPCAEDMERIRDFHIAKSKSSGTLITDVCDEVTQIILDNGWSVEKHPELI